MGGITQEVFFYDHNPLDDPTGGVVIMRWPPNPSRPTGIDPDLKGEHFDEFALGYESEVGGGYKLGIRGVLRKLREIIQNSDDPVTGVVQAIVGNPGRGLLAHMPKATRDYSALEADP